MSNEQTSSQQHVQIWNGNENKHLNIMSLKIENTQRQNTKKIQKNPLDQTNMETFFLLL